MQFDIHLNTGSLFWEFSPSAKRTSFRAKATRGTSVAVVEESCLPAGKASKYHPVLIKKELF